MNKLTDASVFSKTHDISLGKSITKSSGEELVKQLIQNIGKPLAHNGIIVGHIKVLAKISDEEFIFLSLTRLDIVDLKFSAQWDTGLSSEFNSIKLDINVLVFGYSDEVIEQVVNSALAILRRDCETIVS